MAYKANRNNDNLRKDQYAANSSATDKKQEQNDKTADAIKKGAEVVAGAKGGKLGQQVAKKALNSKAGQKAVNKAAKIANKNPIVPLAVNAADKVGLTDAFDKINNRKNQNGLPPNQSPENPASSGQSPDNKDNKESNGSQNNESGGNETPDFSSEQKKKKRKSVFDTIRGNGESSGGMLENAKGIIKIMIKHPLVSAIVIGVLALGVILAMALLINTTSTEKNFDDDFSISSLTGQESGGNTYANINESKDAFLQRVISVTGADDDIEESEDFEYTDENYAYLVVVATYHVINERDSTYTYDYFTKSKIRQIKRQIKFDDNSTKAALAKNVFPKYFKDLSELEYELFADEVFQHIADYYSYIGKEKDSFDSSLCTTITSSNCTYGVKGYYSAGKGNVKKETNISNIKVRLVDCDNNKKALSDEGLIDFEKYVLGVAYAELENGEKEAFKAQAIAARNYALTRGLSSGIKKEGNDSIIEISSCPKTQVYCDPDKGCSKKGNNYVSGQDNTFYKKELSSDNKLRSYAKEVEGKLLVNDQGYIVNTTYSSTEQGQFNKIASSGKDYKEILLQVYGQKFPSANVSGLSGDSCQEVNNCLEYGYAASGDYTSWKQTDKNWSSTPLGTSSATLGSAGCTITAIAIQIKRSGVDTSKVGPVFNPGTFAQALNKVNGFDDEGNLYWDKISSVVPDFKRTEEKKIKGKTKTEKIKILQDLLSKDCYVVAEVKGITPYQHWVAINQVSGNKVTMMDPGSSSTDLFKTYSKYDGARYECFKANK